MRRSILKYSLILMSALIMFSCGSSKRMRKVERASVKIEKLVQKFPELKTIDTIPFEVIVEVPVIEMDTVIKLETDTVHDLKTNTVTITISPPPYFIYEKDGVTAELIRISNTEYEMNVEVNLPPIIATGEVTNESIQPTKYIEKELSKFKQFLLTSGWVIWILVILAIGLKLLKVFGKVSIPFMIAIMGLFALL